VKTLLGCRSTVDALRTSAAAIDSFFSPDATGRSTAGSECPNHCHRGAMALAILMFATAEAAPAPAPEKPRQLEAAVGARM
jgi:hypothetical protein